MQTPVEREREREDQVTSITARKNEGLSCVKSVTQQRRQARTRIMLFSAAQGCGLQTRELKSRCTNYKYYKFVSHAAQGCRLQAGESSKPDVQKKQMCFSCCTGPSSPSRRGIRPCWPDGRCSSVGSSQLWELHCVSLRTCIHTQTYRSD